MTKRGFRADANSSPVDAPTSIGSLNATCLLAVRRAGGAFEGQHNIRSTHFELLLLEYDSLSSQIAGAQRVLLQELYEAVPQASTSLERHIILQIKRKIANCAAVPDHDLTVLAPEQRLRVKTYTRDVLAREAMFDDKRESIFNDFRRQLNALICDEDFCYAVNYSCPWLIDAYRSHGPGGNTSFSNEERGLYSYATRFFSKANPFHVFASIALPAYLGLSIGDEYEVVINTSVILQLEKQLLPRSKDKYLYLRSFLERDNAYEFFVVSGSCLRRFTIPKNPVIKVIVEFFRTRRLKYSTGTCLAYLMLTFAETVKSDIERYVLLLIERGILVEYLVTDFEDFANNLLGVDPDYDAVIASLQELHLTRLAKRDLSRVNHNIEPVFKTDLNLEGTIHYLNAYSEIRTEDYEQSANGLHSTLQAIKPLLTPCSNFADWAYVSAAFIHDRCAAHSNRRVPYMVLLTEFCRDMRSILFHYEPSIHRSQEKQEARRAWLQLLVECKDTLSDEQLSLLISERPRGQEYSGSICFNGAFDAMNGLFYPHNFFAGNGRYISRYLIGDAGRRSQRIVKDKDSLDVQLVPGYEDNRFYVAPVLPTGCGFDARYRHRFARWIDPAEVIVTSQGENITYHDASGRILRFHYFGFLLGQALRPEYQLLLTSHADFFFNPFERRPTSSNSVERCAPLYYRSVCLRREQWRFSKAFFQSAWRHADILRCTIALLESLREVGVDFTESYFELFDPTAQGRKPRYLDLCNPLSVHVFRRAIRSSSASTVVSLSRMEPPAENLFREGQCPHVTELMIEA